MLRFVRLAQLAAVVLVLLAASITCHSDCLLKPGDRMVFLGDSITEQRNYTRFVMDYFALRYPGQKIEFRNAGWVSDTAVGGLKRLQRDVLDLKPTVVSICYGMNDAGVSAYNQATYDRYIGAMKELIDTLHKRNIRVVLITAGCVDESKASRLAGYNATLGQFAKQLCEFAAKENVPCYNIHDPMLQMLNAAKAADPGFVMMNDGVHPNHSGHIVMAYGLLKALGCAGSASGLAIDAKASKAECDRCKVEGLNVTESEITFKRTDDALPLYLDDDAWNSVKYFPPIEEFDAYKLKVTGLKPGNWKLSVEGAAIGTYTDEELANSINLAAAPGPWKQLGSDVNDITTDQEGVYYTRWRQLQLGQIPDFASKEKQALLSKLDSYVATREADRIARATKPNTWTWTLQLAK